MSEKTRDAFQFCLEVSNHLSPPNAENLDDRLKACRSLILGFSGTKTQRAAVMRILDQLLAPGCSRLTTNLWNGRLVGHVTHLPKMTYASSYRSRYQEMIASLDVPIAPLATYNREEVI